MTIGGRIKEVREKRGMTQEELAVACGYKSRSTINKFEKDICEIKLSNVQKIADALNVDPDYLVFGNDDGAPIAPEPVVVHETLQQEMSRRMLEKMIEFYKKMTLEQQVAVFEKVMKEEIKK